jgi:hypothetical protein
MKCQCGAVTYAPEWCVLPGGAPLPAGTPVYCGACTPATYSVNETERYERFGATLAPAPRPHDYEVRTPQRELWRA